MRRPALTTRERVAKQHRNMAPMIIEHSKRKALDDLESPSANKRIKNSHATAPETERRPLKVVPFPEKVCESGKQNMTRVGYAH
ncbi:MAG: hypothetical protein LQ347_006655 [Umbilicaria vellea]|nr:MAG: hypothetical protein LQ347_006655 [Umbilicaria vellea]